MESNIPYYFITALTKISTSQLYKIRVKTLKRGYNPVISKFLLDSYIADKCKPGRPSVLTLNIIQMIEDIITKNSITRSWSCGNIAVEIATRLGVEKAIYAKSVYKVLKAKKYRSCKQTIKPGLTKEIKEAYWNWYLAYKDWTMEDWKNVIWIDETSI
jgi:hypothetical protein